MVKEPNCDYDKRSISVVICDTDTASQLTKSWLETVKLSM